ncbi:TIGR02265 family protein [Archangium violaceum]|uniref:TIGR02265 family protein n=1 Tax=Archangium violaceum TaxID=83451 RepID=UPI0036DA1439
MNQEVQVVVPRFAREHWAPDFARRISLATPADTARGVFCIGLLKAMEDMGGAEAARHCLQASGETAFVELFSYPIASYLRMVSTAVQLLAPKYGDIEESLRRIGRRAAADFRESSAGRAMGVMHEDDARRLLDCLPVVYRIALSFGMYELSWVEPAHARFRMQRTFIPYPFHEGVLLELLEKTKVLRLKVRGRQTSALDSEYDICWG